MQNIQWNFEGKKALVTGGSRGIGRAIVKKLALAGAEVIFTYLNHYTEAEQLELEMNGKGGRVKAIKCDFTQKKDIENLIFQVCPNRRSPLNYLVNNAGIVRDAPLHMMEDSQWEDVMQVNLNAMFFVTKGVLKNLMVSRGNIVNVSSTSGLIGGEGQVNYATSKAGTIGFTRSLSTELASCGIRVNGVAPGFTRTESFEENTLEKKKEEVGNYMPLKRIALPEEIANMVLFLLSQESSYITGKVFAVDGGLT
ncbi:SDR family NAD(P)-dependent oxidoreductase [Cytobacillus oceanisediminis]|uniref:SDR family NAD(P)-dependent oxidoreductase n=1 Tax=Cytobacillus oceanisediminis TaxID=665099 RepID=UPI001C2194C7|nr:3-oxoacyl-ACP reductase family protein [Cytobacillus oceanisediminis]MBU8772044.1 3-oxoacyl-ACP reductase FabG [Cytobacillus oceanisediminis]